jgi:hypothetical protein
MSGHPFALSTNSVFGTGLEPRKKNGEIGCFSRNRLDRILSLKDSVSGFSTGVLERQTIRPGLPGDAKPLGEKSHE